MISRRINDIQQRGSEQTFSSSIVGSKLFQINYTKFYPHSDLCYYDLQDFGFNYASVNFFEYRPSDIQ